MKKRKKKISDRYEPLRALYAKKVIYLKKNIRVQLFNKAIREGWVFEKSIFPSFYSFNSPDTTIRMTIEIETTRPPHKVNFFDNREPDASAIDAQIAEVSYKYYLRYGSEMVLMESLM